MHGVGAHGASPHRGVDPVLVAAQIVVSLQSLVSRTISPLESGVITVGAVLGMASHLEHRACSIYDMTGLSQKNGAVVTHLKLAESQGDISSIRIAAGGADV